MSERDGALLKCTSCHRFGEGEGWVVYGYRDVWEVTFCPECRQEGEALLREQVPMFRAFFDACEKQRVSES